MKRGSYVKRGQVAMEFLMTYGWAIIIILLAIATLWMLGVFSPSVSTTCQIEAPFTCQDAVVADNAIILKLGANRVQTANINNINVNGQACPLLTNTQLTSNQITTVRCTGLSLDENEKVTVEISATYKKQGGGLTHSIEGTVSGQASLGSYVYNNDPALVTAYDFESGKAKDLSGNNYDGVVTGSGCSSEGKIGDGCTFDGTGTTYVTIPETNAWDFNDADSFSIELWVKFEAGYTDGAAIVEKWNGGSVDYPFVIRQYGSGGSPLIEFAQYHDNPVSGTSVISSSGEIQLDNWHHIVVVYDAALGTNDVILYVDGVKVDETTDSTDPTENDHPILLGTRGGLPSNTWMFGSLDELAIYTRALSATEAKEHYDRTK
tara:strand:+ start:1956 stop:3086 length:1131 start_codon:yes stop_codon:yes gene_type:complete